MNKIIYITSFIIFTFFSCVGKSSKTCNEEKEYYTEKWDYIVSETYKSTKSRATYVIVTTEGKEIYFQPTQDIVTFVQTGDKIYKEPYSEFAYWINSNNDTLKSRIYSTYCDDKIEKFLLEKELE